MEDIADNICQILTILFNNIIIEISNIYVRNTGYLLQDININWFRKNSQHSMLASPVFNDIFIYTYKLETLLTFMLAYGAYTTPTLK